MNKKELVAAVAEKLGLSKAQVESVLSTMEDVVLAEVKSGNEVKLSLGKFVKAHREAKPAREGVNPKNPSEKIKIPAQPAKDVLTFKVFKSVRDL